MDDLTEPISKASQSSSLNLEKELNEQLLPSEDVLQINSPSRRKLYLTLLALILVTIPPMSLLYYTSRTESPGYREVLFEPRIFARTSLEESNKAWKCLPNGNGLVQLPLDSKKLPRGLPSGEDGERELYGISWTHQLFCLGIVRDEFYALLEGGERNATERILDRDERGDEEGYRMGVVEECFDYLRQKIFCVADMTVEGVVEGGRLNGFGIVHSCRVKVCF